ncbi:uncharacterized protein TNCV_2369711 [Trichonephila clavipes]|nr:uncharacterized protein TNCV_2369711 [Trichonephila clavipes]
MSPHTITPVVILSSLLGYGTTPNGGINGWASRAAHVMGPAIPNVLQPGAFVWFETTYGPLVMVLPVPVWQPMNQLADMSSNPGKGRNVYKSLRPLGPLSRKSSREVGGCPLTNRQVDLPQSWSDE